MNMDSTQEKGKLEVVEFTSGSESELNGTTSEDSATSDVQSRNDETPSPGKSSR